MNPLPAYKFKAAERFWTAFYALPDAQKESLRAAWRKFKVNALRFRCRRYLKKGTPLQGPDG